MTYAASPDWTDLGYLASDWLSLTTHSVNGRQFQSLHLISGDIKYPEECDKDHLDGR